MKKMINTYIDLEEIQSAMDWLNDVASSEAFQMAEDNSGHRAAVDIMINLLKAARGKQDINDKVIEVERLENAVALLLNANAPAPYIVASGYNPETRSWSSGSYHSDLLSAAIDARYTTGCEMRTTDYVRPLLACDFDAIEDSVLWWSRSDFQDVIESEIGSCEDEEIDAVIDATGRMRWWKDYATSLGYEEYIAPAAKETLDEDSTR